MVDFGFAYIIRLQWFGRF